MYQPYIPAVILSVLSLGLLGLRFINTGSDRFSFMAWNLFLAWLPMLWAYLLASGLKTNRWLSFKNVLLSFLWLAFLPNTFYLVTDFIHLRGSTLSNVLYDSVMFMSFALTGVILGCMSVYLVHRELAKRWPRNTVWAFLLIFFVLSSLAIYLGRYLGWNSWDLVANPLYILLDLSNRLTNPDSLTVTLGTTVLFFGFITAAYVAFYAGIKAVRASK